MSIRYLYKWTEKLTLVIMYDRSLERVASTNGPGTKDVWIITKASFQNLNYVGYKMHHTFIFYTQLNFALPFIRSVTSQCNTKHRSRYIVLLGADWCGTNDFMREFTRPKSSEREKEFPDNERALCAGTNCLQSTMNTHTHTHTHTSTQV